MRHCAGDQVGLSGMKLTTETSFIALLASRSKFQPFFCSLSRTPIPPQASLSRKRKGCEACPQQLLTVPIDNHDGDQPFMLAGPRELRAEAQRVGSPRRRGDAEKTEEPVSISKSSSACSANALPRRWRTSVKMWAQLVSLAFSPRLRVSAVNALLT